MKVADRWKLGKKTPIKGLLMVVAVNDRKMYILTGYGLEGTLPDAVAKRIISDDITQDLNKVIMPGYHSGY